MQEQINLLQYVDTTSEYHCVKAEWMHNGLQLGMDDVGLSRADGRDRGPSDSRNLC